ncbi:hypothetical protein [Streptomyces sp. KR55]
MGELTAVVPFELVDAVLQETRSVQSRLRSNRRTPVLARLATARTCR